MMLRIVLDGSGDDVPEVVARRWHGEVSGRIVHIPIATEQEAAFILGEIQLRHLVLDAEVRK
jgi:hypothetical protein